MNGDFWRIWSFPAAGARCLRTPDARIAPLRIPLATLASLLALVAPLGAEELELIEVPAGRSATFQPELEIDGGRAFAFADIDTADVWDFYSVELAGGPPVRLNEALGPSDVIAYGLDLSPDRSTVLYAVEATSGDTRLYSVPVEGPDTASVRLDTDTAWDKFFNTGVRIDANGQFVVFVANLLQEDVWELFSVPLGGPAGTAVRLNEPLLSSHASTALLTPDGQRVVYMADQDALELGVEIHSVPIDGSATSTRIAPGGASLSGFSHREVTSTRVIFRQNNRLWSVPIEGPAASAIEISRSLVGGEFVRSGYRIAPDGQTVLYEVDTGPTNELYSVPIDGPAMASVQLTPGGRSPWEYFVSPDAERVVYRSSRLTGNGFELWSVPIVGPDSAGVLLNQTIVPENGGVHDVKISPDSSRVVFQGSLDTQGQPELWRVPIEGPANLGFKLSPDPLPGYAEVFFDFQISGDSERVAYRVDLDSDGVFDLYSVGIDGPTGSGIKLNGPLAPGGDVCANQADCYRFAADHRRVVYEAEVDADQDLDLFIADDGQAAAAFAQPAYDGNEGTTLDLQIDIGSSSVLTVTMDVVQTGGAAQAGIDYTFDGSIEIPPGATSTVLPVTFFADQVADDDETLVLSLTNIVNAGVSTPSTTVITIGPPSEIFADGFESGDVSAWSSRAGG